MKKNRQASASEPSQRQLRVGEQLRHLISETLRRGHFGHEVLLNCSNQITVSQVRPSPDLKHARVYVSAIGDMDIAQILPVLNEEAHVFQRVIGTSSNLKFTPRVRFVIDESIAHAQRIEDLLRGIKIPEDDDQQEE